MFVFEKGIYPQNKVQHTDKHVTPIGFTALNGQIVLFLFIIAGVAISLNDESCIDLFVTETHTVTLLTKIILTKTLVLGTCYEEDCIVGFKIKVYPALSCGL